MLAGAIGGIGYWTACYPFDVVKTRIQNQSDVNPKYKGMVDCFKTIMKEEGIAAFGRGYTSAVARAIPAASSTFLVYQYVKKWLE